MNKSNINTDNQQNQPEVDTHQQNQNLSISRDDHKKLTKLIHSLIQNEHSVEFRKPVYYKSLGLDDYKKIIKKPMDLNTVRRNLNKNMYKYIDEFCNDTFLIWNNCKLYNEEGSGIYIQADEMEKYFIEQLKEFYPNFNFKSPSIQLKEMQEQLLLEQKQEKIQAQKKEQVHLQKNPKEKQHSPNKKLEINFIKEHSGQNLVISQEKNDKNKKQQKKELNLITPEDIMIDDFSDADLDLAVINEKTNDNDKSHLQQQQKKNGSKQNKQYINQNHQQSNINSSNKSKIKIKKEKQKKKNSTLQNIQMDNSVTNLTDSLLQESEPQQNSSHINQKNKKRKQSNSIILTQVIEDGSKKIQLNSTNQVSINNINSNINNQDVQIQNNTHSMTAVQDMESSHISNKSYLKKSEKNLQKQHDMNQKQMIQNSVLKQNQQSYLDQQNFNNQMTQQPMQLSFLNPRGQQKVNNMNQQQQLQQQQGQNQQLQYNLSGNLPIPHSSLIELSKRIGLQNKRTLDKIKNIIIFNCPEIVRQQGQDNYVIQFNQINKLTFNLIIDFLNHPDQYRDIYNIETTNPFLPNNQNDYIQILPGRKINTIKDQYGKTVHLLAPSQWAIEYNKVQQGIQRVKKAMEQTINMVEQNNQSITNSINYTKNNIPQIGLNQISNSTQNEQEQGKQSENSSVQNQQNRGNEGIQIQIQQSQQNDKLNTVAEQESEVLQQNQQQANKKDGIVEISSKYIDSSDDEEEIKFLNQFFQLDKKEENEIDKLSDFQPEDLKQQAIEFVSEKKTKNQNPIEGQSTNQENQNKMEQENTGVHDENKENKKLGGKKIEGGNNDDEPSTNNKQEENNLKDNQNQDNIQIQSQKQKINDKINNQQENQDQNIITENQQDKQKELEVHQINTNKLSNDLLLEKKQLQDNHKSNQNTEQINKEKMEQEFTQAQQIEFSIQEQNEYLQNTKEQQNGEQLIDKKKQQLQQNGNFIEEENQDNQININQQKDEKNIDLGELQKQNRVNGLIQQNQQKTQLDDLQQEKQYSYKSQSENVQIEQNIYNNNSSHSDKIKEIQKIDIQKEEDEKQKDLNNQIQNIEEQNKNNNSDINRQTGDQNINQNQQNIQIKNDQNDNGLINKINSMR